LSARPASPETVATPRASRRTTCRRRSLTSSVVAGEPTGTAVEAADAVQTARVRGRTGKAVADGVAASAARRGTRRSSPRPDPTTGREHAAGAGAAAGADAARSDVAACARSPADHRPAVAGEPAVANEPAVADEPAVAGRTATSRRATRPSTAGSPAGRGGAAVPPRTDPASRITRAETRVEAEPGPRRVLVQRRTPEASRCDEDGDERCMNRCTTRSNDGSNADHRHIEPYERGTGSSLSRAPEDRPPPQPSLVRGSACE
jgi:hypothetical protein